MFAWHRALTVALLITVGTAGVARAETPQARAKTLNDQGKGLMFATPPNYDAAAVKFRQAIVLSPEGKYYFNLCLALYSNGDFGNALMSCQAVEQNGADEKVKKNASDLIVKIREQMTKQGMNPDAVQTVQTNPNPNPDNTNPNPNPDNTNPNPNPDNTNPNPNPNNPNPNPIPLPANNQFRGAPPPSLFQMTPPSHDYTYTLGGAFLAGGASVGSQGAYGGSVAGFRFFGDLLFAPAAKIGGEGYIDVMNVPDGGPLSMTQGLTIVDFGVGIYKHFCTGRVCLTPLVGAHVVGYQPGSRGTGSSDYASLGLRLQGQVGYAFGSRYEHYLFAQLGVDLDAKPIGTYDLPPDDQTIGLDKGGALVMLSIGYQYRFNTPFGQSPFFQLE